MRIVTRTLQEFEQELKRDHDFLERRPARNEHEPKPKPLLRATRYQQRSGLEITTLGVLSAKLDMGDILTLELELGRSFGGNPLPGLTEGLAAFTQETERLCQELELECRTGRYEDT